MKLWVFYIQYVRNKPLNGRFSRVIFWDYLLGFGTSIEGIETTVVEIVLRLSLPQEVTENLIRTPNDEFITRCF